MSENTEIVTVTLATGTVVTGPGDLVARLASQSAQVQAGRVRT